MANDYFRFRQFIIRQDRVAMKVGTDGTLLGAWARGGCHVLDIGTGTGLVALMMAQRYAGASVLGIDIDRDAVEQARENVAVSPFADRVDILQMDIARQRPRGMFESIVSNPPYFHHALVSPNARRTLARHTVSLTYADLMRAAQELLTDDGELSLVIPVDCKGLLESEALLAGLCKSREWSVKTTPQKPVRRYLLAFRKHLPEQLERGEGIIEVAHGERSEWYHGLTKEFYL